MIVPAGHRKENDSNELVEVDSSLEIALNGWLYGGLPFYDEALAVLSGTDSDPMEVQRLLQRRVSDMTDTQIIDFLNASYFHTSRKYIDSSIAGMPWIGGHLAEDKLLYTSARTLDRLGNYSSGVVVSSADTGYMAGFGMESSGVLIQAANAGSVSCGDGLSIALFEPDIYADMRVSEGNVCNDKGRAVRHKEVSPELRGYCENLIDVCNAGEDAVYREFGDCPANTVREALYGLVGWRPVEVEE